MTETQALPTYPFARTCPYHPPGEYEGFRERGLVQVSMFDGRPVWLATRFADVRALLTDSRVSVDRRHPGFPFVAPRESEYLDFFRQIAGLDGDEHKERRQMLQPSFVIKQVERMRPEIQRAADELLDQLLAAGPPMDLMADFAKPLPARVIGQLLGVPHEDYELFGRLSLNITTAATAEEAGAASEQLQAYLDTVVQAKRDNPADDLLSVLVAEQMEAGRITRADMTTLALVLLVAGHESTACMIAMGVLTLLEHPDQLAVLRDEPAALTGLVEELLRFLSVADLGSIRLATADIQIGDQTIKAGDGVILSTAGANWDQEKFTDPHVIDAHRPAVRQQLAFGHGVHRCIGEHLVRAELEIVYSTLFRRIPTLRLTVPVEQLPVRFNMTVEGVLEMPVTW
jgi:pentalenic acid synthase